MARQHMALLSGVGPTPMTLSPSLMQLPHGTNGPVEPPATLVAAPLQSPGLWQTRNGPAAPMVPRPPVVVSVLVLKHLLSLSPPRLVLIGMIRQKLRTRHAVLETPPQLLPLITPLPP